MATQHELAQIRSKALAQRDYREKLRRTPPAVRLWDGDWNFRGEVTGEYESSFGWKLNDTGAGQITLPADHYLAQWAMDTRGRKTKNIHVTCDKDGMRWGGRLEDYELTQDEDGSRMCRLNFLNDYEELKHIQVWSNPFTPAAVQFPKKWRFAGPAKTILKLTLLVNLMRLNGNLWRLPDNPLSISSWIQGARYSQWPVVVAPQLTIKDSSPWTVIHGRFKDFHDLAASVCADGHLMITTRRWLEGDPQPWPGAMFTRSGQLIVDIEDKSGWFEQTAIGGTIAGGLLRTGLQVADNLIDETRNLLDMPLDAPQYTISGFLGVAPAQPWVVYDVNGDTNTVSSAKFTWKPATVTQITVGGHSMPGVNEGISIATKFVFNFLGSFILQPGLGSIADSVVAPLYEDVLLAFTSFKSPLRSMKLGWSHYYENFSDDADNAFTLSALLALRKGFFDSREMITHSISVSDGAPYLIGEQGQGHFGLGDRVGTTRPGDESGQVFVEQVTELVLAWSAEQPHEWAITLGDFEADYDPVASVIGKVGNISAAIHDMSVN